MRDGGGLGVVLLISIVGRKVCRLDFSAMAFLRNRQAQARLSSVFQLALTSFECSGSFWPCIQTVSNHGSL